MHSELPAHQQTPEGAQPPSLAARPAAAPPAAPSPVLPWAAQPMSQAQVGFVEMVLSCRPLQCG